MSFFQQQETAAGDHRFRQTVRHAVLKCAVDVSAEAGEVDTPRKRLAGAILSPGGAAQYLEVFAPACATNPVVTKDATDDAIEFTVASLWDAVSRPFGIAAKPMEAAKAQTADAVAKGG